MIKDRMKRSKLHSVLVFGSAICQVLAGSSSPRLHFLSPSIALTAQFSMLRFMVFYQQRIQITRFFLLFFWMVHAVWIRSLLFISLYLMYTSMYVHCTVSIRTQKTLIWFRFLLLKGNIDVACSSSPIHLHMET